jgi:hypothetical protein
LAPPRPVILRINDDSTRMLLFASGDPIDQVFQCVKGLTTPADQCPGDVAGDDQPGPLRVYDGFHPRIDTHLLENSPENMAALFQYSGIHAP